MPADHLTVGYDSIGFNSGVLVSIVQAVLAFFGFGPAHGAVSGISHYDSILTSLYFAWQVYSVFALFLSALFLYGIVYARIKMGEQGQVYHHKLQHAEEEYKRLYERHETHGKFETIEQHASSDNPNDWRLAVIEADILLEQLLEEHGFRGLTIGEKLKSASRETLRSLDDAWEAHKVRNEIAHRGGDFILTKKIVNETLAKYRRVFGELQARDPGASGGGHH